MNDNYPAGAANDPLAPWNAPDPVYEECDECEAGVATFGGVTGVCEKCDGDGEVEVSPDELADRAEVAAEAKGDWERESRASHPGRYRDY